jgi:hypothetical protein
MFFPMHTIIISHQNLQAICEFPKLQMCEVAQKLMNTLLFSFQDLKLSIRDIIAVLNDTLNTIANPLPSLIRMLQGSHPTPWRDIQLAHVLKMAFVIWLLVLAWLN